MRTFLQQHSRALLATLRKLARAPLTTLLGALAIGITLALPLGAYVLLDNVQRLARHADGDPQLTIYMARDASAGQTRALEAQLGAATAVRKIRWVSRDEALAELKRSDQFGDVAALLQSNPLPDAFVTDLHTGRLDEAAALAERLRQSPGVAEVQLDTVWIERLHAGLRIGSILVTLLAILLAFGLAAVTFNTVRMQIITQRDEMEVARLVGATDAYVRRPYYYQGALLGALGALVAVLLLMGSAWWLNGELARLGQSYAVDLRLHLPPVPDLLGVALFASALGWLGAHASVSKHLLNH